MGGGKRPWSPLEAQVAPGPAPAPRGSGGGRGGPPLQYGYDGIGAGMGPDLAEEPAAEQPYEAVPRARRGQRDDGGDAAMPAGEWWAH